MTAVVPTADQDAARDQPPPGSGEQAERGLVGAVEQLAGESATDSVVGGVEHHRDQNTVAGRVEQRGGDDAGGDDGQ